jgi:PKD repeat protein
MKKLSSLLLLLLSGIGTLSAHSFPFFADAAPTRVDSSSAMIVIDGVITEASCGCNGAITLFVSGGVAPYTYDWSHLPGNDDPANLNDLCQGTTYIVTVTDATGASAFRIFSLLFTNSLSLNSTVINAGCNGPSGAISFSPSGGAGPYTYTYESGFNDYNQVPPGSYCVTVTSAGGCTTSSCATVEQVPTLEAYWDAIDVISFGSFSGSIDLTVCGGVAPYTYEWIDLPGYGPEDRTGLSSGTYFITVTDASNCSRVLQANVGNPQSGSTIAVSASINRYTCACTGRIALTPVTGSPPYDYQWSNNASTSAIENLCVGEYRVTVTDANGAQFFELYQIKPPLGGEVSLDIISSIPTFCADDANTYGCWPVCPNSIVTYYAAPNDSLCGNSPTTFRWEVTGAQDWEVSPDTRSVTVQWRATGAGQLTCEGAGNIHCFTKTICTQVSSLAKAQFSTNPLASSSDTTTLTVCRGQTVWFNNESVDAEDFEWQFPDTYTSTDEANPSHRFQVPGTHVVLLIARRACLCPDTALLRIRVLDSEAPSFDCVSAVCPGEAITYTTTSVCSEYDWDWSANGTVTAGGGPTDAFVSILWNEGSNGTLSLEVPNCQAAACPVPALAQIPILSDAVQIEGDDLVCVQSEATYRITQFEGATYEWSISSGGILLEGQGRNEIRVDWGNSPAQQYVIVAYENCYLGCAGRDTLPVLIRPVRYIGGDYEVCEGGTETFTFGPTVTNWQVFDFQNNTLLNEVNNIALNQNFSGFAAGLYRINTRRIDLSTCTDSAAWTVEVKPRPAKPTSIAGSTFFCAGQPLTFEAMGVEASNNIFWSIKNSNQSPISKQGNPVVTDFVNGAPRWVAASQVTADDLGCQSDTTRLLVVQSLDLTIGGPTALCAGASGTYSAPDLGAGNYIWGVEPPEAAVIQSGQGTRNVQISWPQAGTFTVVLGACEGFETIVVNVSANPEPAPQAPTGVCPGQMVTVTEPNNFFSYQWKRATGGISIGNDASVMLEPGAYAVVATTSLGCRGTTSFSIQEFPAPTAFVTTLSPTFFCNNSQEVTIVTGDNNDGSLQFQWFRDNLPFGNNEPALVTSEYGQYTVQVTNEYGCSDTDGTVNVFEYCQDTVPGYDPGTGVPLPSCPPGTASVQQTPYASCDSIGFQLITNVNYQAGSLRWTFVEGGTGAIIDTASTEFTVQKFEYAGQYLALARIQLPNGAVCVAFDSVIVEAVAEFFPLTGCEGVLVGFQDQSTFLPGSNITQWRWDFGEPNATNDTSVVRNAVWIYNTPGVFSPTLTVTALSGCTASITRAVNVAPSPDYQFYPLQANCSGNATPLGIFNSDLYRSVEWDFGDPSSGPLNEAEGHYVYHKYNDAGTYSVRMIVTNLAGCRAIDTLSVEINPNALVGQVSPVNSVICENSSLTLTAPNAGPGGAYLWSNGASGATITVQTEGIYQVTITAADGCTYSPPAKVLQVQPTPDALIEALQVSQYGQVTGAIQNQIELCEGEDLFLNVQANAFNYAVAWSTANQTGYTLTFTDERNNLLPVGTFDYQITVTNATTGCSVVSPPFGVQVHPRPANLQITASQTCAGLPNTLAATGSVPPEWTLIWNNGQTTPSFVTTESGLFFLQAINQFGCRGKSNELNIRPGPNVAAIPGGCRTRCNPDTLCILPIEGIMQSQWLLNGSPIVGQTSLNFVATQTGTYQVLLTDTTGCQAISEPLFLDLYGGYGNIFGAVYSDVNNNGLIDAADTLIQNIPILLRQNGLQTTQNASNNLGQFVFSNLASYGYNVLIDNDLLPENWDIVVGSDSVTIANCGQVDSVRLLLHDDLCPNANSTRTERVCADATYTFLGLEMPIGSTQIFALSHPTTGCDSLVTVSVEALPTATSSRTERVCADATYTFLGVEMPIGSTQIFALSHPTTGCDSLVTVSVEALPTATSSRTERVCADATYTFLGLEMPIGSTQIFTLSHPTTGCDSLVTVSVEALPTADTDLNVWVCAGDTYAYADSALAAGQTYEFHFTNQNDCDSTVFVTVSAHPPLEFELGSTAACPDAATGAIEILGSAGGVLPIEYTLDGQTFQALPRFDDLSAGGYRVILRDAADCLATDSVEVAQRQPLQVILTDALLPCDTTSLRLRPLVSGDSEGLEYRWSTGATTAILDVDAPATYHLEVRNTCESVRQSAVVTWAESADNPNFVYVPNAVAPEAQHAANAQFGVVLASGLTVRRFRMEVFDRWGNQVFATDDPSEAWDPQSMLAATRGRNRATETAVYVWWLDVDFEFCGRTLRWQRRGDVTVVR